MTSKGMKKAELLFVSFPAMGHVVSAVELAKLLVHRDDRLSVTFLIMEPVLDSMVGKYVDSLTLSTMPSSIKFIRLPITFDLDSVSSSSGNYFVSYLIESQKPHIKEVASRLAGQQLKPDSPQLAGFVLDLCCAEIVDVANEFGIPSYLFWSTNAAFLGYTFWRQAIHDERKIEDSDAEFAVPGLMNALPAKCVPALMRDKDGEILMHKLVRKGRETRGIMVNTFIELESHAIESLSVSHAEVPPIYPVGPILNLKDNLDMKYDGIMRWLDDQPPSSVLFLCFGSWGSFGVDQIKEIAYALEHSGHRFLWSLRRSGPKGKIKSPSDYANPEEVLPTGFLDRTVRIGKVIGWAPQVNVLAHQAVGGFVSHLWMEFCTGKSVVWCSNCHMANLCRATIQCF